MIKLFSPRYILILFLLVNSAVFSQEKAVEKVANKYFDNGNFKDALEQYLELLKSKPENVKLNYRTGVCYLNTNIDKSNAIPYLEKSLSLDNVDPNIYYLLGRAYHFAYRFNDAISMYQKFKKINKGNKDNLNDVDKQLDHSYNAIEIMKFPLDITFKNLGASINSTTADYYPFVPLDESYLIYNAKREDGSTKLPDGSFNSEVYISKIENGEYANSKKMDQSVNTLNGSEEIIGLSADGKHLLFYYENEEYSGDIFIADYLDSKVQNILKLPKEINSFDHEIAASISRNGNVIYFASDRVGGYGGVDIYSSRLLPNGKWGPAQNLGATVNTKYDEDFPSITSDNKTLYFSSKGHTGMGGYDMFKVTWNSAKRNWNDVKNLGYPLNTPEDNMNYRESKSGRTGYLSALRAEGFGDLDIYSVTYNEVDPEYTVLKGFVKTDDSVTIKDVFISVFDLETDELYGSYLTNATTGRYVIILPPGEFTLEINFPGFEMYTEKIEVFGKSSFRSVIKKDFTINSLNKN